MIDNSERREVARMAESIADVEAQLWKLCASRVLGTSVKGCAAVDKLLAKCQGYDRSKNVPHRN